MNKTSYINIPKVCTVKKLIDLFDHHLKKDNFSNLAISLGKNKKINGIISLGDLRRILIKNGMNDNIHKYLNKKPFIINEKNLNNKLNTLINNAEKKNKKINQVIILNNKKDIIAIENLDTIRNNSKYKEITVVGLGHIGLPLAIHLLKNFTHINGYDKNSKKIDKIKNLDLDFYEKNLKTSLQKNIANKKFNLEKKLENINSQIYIICIGSDIKNNKISNKNLISIIKKISKKIKLGDLIILRGTVQVGVCRNLVVPLLEKNSNLKCGIDFNFSYLPERIVEGDALYELENMAQIVSGFSKKCKDKVMEFCSKSFKSLVELDNMEEGEIIKLASNSYRDLSFAFANEISRISSYYNLSGNSLIKKANLGYPRNSIAKPSMGVGGFCLTKDPYLFSKLFKSKKKGYILSKNSRYINVNSIVHIFNQIKKFIDKNINVKNPRIVILGTTFKGYPETIDTRSSPSIEIAKKFILNKCYIKLYDSMYHELKKIKFELSDKLTNNEKFINKSDIVILANNHELYPKMIDKNLKKNSSNHRKLVFDCWSLLDKQIVKNLNWDYKNI